MSPLEEEQEHGRFGDRNADAAKKHPKKRTNLILLEMFMLWK